MNSQTARFAHSQDGDIVDLVHFEQRVNERLGSDAPPRIAPELLPEAGVWRPLAWARVPRMEVKLLSDDPDRHGDLERALDCGDGTFLFPVHPLVEKNYPPDMLLYLGRFTASASYRTVFFSPDPGALEGLIPPGHLLMIKLHLDEPLPGIAGDRRLTPEKVRKCIELSALLPSLVFADGAEHPRLTILREPFGLIHGQRGAIFRVVPQQNLVPIFALYSRDSTPGAGSPILVSLIHQLNWTPDQVAARLADWFARPILAGVFAAFQQGFSVEMHAQNTLIELLPEGQFGRVCFRDLESVVFFPELRARQGLAPLQLDHLGAELFQEPRNATRWFNRNVDHDVGRILHWTLRVLEQEGVFGKRHTNVAVRHIRQTTRQLITHFGVDRIARQGRWLPYSRSPYGTGRRRHNYYRTTFR